MPYDEELADRVRSAIASIGRTAEIAMFGGLCFTLNRHMFVGVMNDDLMVRVGPERHDETLKLKGARPMDFSGRPMKGYVFIDKGAIRDRRTLERWIKMGSEFAST